MELGGKPSEPSRKCTDHNDLSESLKTAGFRLSLEYLNGTVDCKIREGWIRSNENRFTIAVHWVQGSHEIHTVTFQAPNQTPPEVIYICVVHGATMSGKVVVPAGQPVPTPAQASASGLAQIDLMRFFPSRLNVRPGDTVVWEYGAGMGMSMAPHTVSFLNGTPDQELIIPVAPPVPPLLLINPMVLLPSAVTNPAQAGQPLTRNGYYNSGLLEPGGSFALKIGAIKGVINYECLLHDASGMVASLNVLPR